MIQQIFLDLDGVLNRFMQHALRSVGYPDACDADFPVECQFDIVGAANKMSGHRLWTNETFWRAITREVWATAPKSEECDLLLGYSVAIVGKENVCLATAPTRDPDSLAGKLEWIHEMLPKWMHRQFFVGPCKHFLAKPGALLVDDADKNVDSFRVAGGSAFLVPRPWNTAHKKDTLTEIHEFFGRELQERTIFGA